MTREQFKAFLVWAFDHPEMAFTLAMAVLSLPGTVYAAIKVFVQRVTGKPVSGAVWRFFDVATEMLPNIPGAISRGLKERLGANLFAYLSGLTKAKVTGTAPPALPSQSPTDPE